MTCPHRNPASRVTALLLVTLFAATLTTSALAGLREDVDRAVRTGNLGSSTIAISVIDAASGQVLVNHDASRPMIPASNQKLLATGTALHVLGPEFTFTTELLRVDNNAIVRGDGDPSFGDADLIADRLKTPDGAALDVEGFLDALVEHLARAFPENRIERLLIDDHIFDQQAVHPTWPIEQLNRAYCAQITGLTFHRNVLHFFPRPTANRPDLTTYRPHATWLSVTNKGTSRSRAKDSNTGWFARKLGTNQLTFFGNIRHPQRVPIEITIDDPAMFLGLLLEQRLRARGIDVGSVERRPLELPIPEDPTVALRITSPLTDVIRHCNVESDNLYAECLLKRVGHARTGQPGSWLNGATIIRHVMHERIDDHDAVSQLIVADGSGMSRDNRIAPHLLTRWLRSLQRDPAIGKVFTDSLALGGRDGTLRASKRPALAPAALGGAQVRAKTGFINGVSCLSGYVIKGDVCRCFSIMVNDIPGTVPIRSAKAVQDAIVKLIAADMPDIPAAVTSAAAAR